MANARRWIGLVLSETAGVGTLAFLFYYLAVSGAPAQSDPWSTDRVIAYLLLVAAPLFMFLPVSLMLRLGPVWLLGAGSWALLGYVLIFVGAPERGSASIYQYMAFLSLVFVALGSTLAVPMGAAGAKLLQSKSMGRSLREGMLLSLCAVSLLAMSPLGVLNWLNALLVFTVVALTEFFFLARGWQ